MSIFDDREWLVLTVLGARWLLKGATVCFATIVLATFVLHLVR